MRRKTTLVGTWVVTSPCRRNKPPATCVDQSPFSGGPAFFSVVIRRSLHLSADNLVIATPPLHPNIGLLSASTIHHTPLFPSAIHRRVPMYYRRQETPTLSPPSRLLTSSPPTASLDSQAQSPSATPPSSTLTYRSLYAATPSMTLASPPVKLTHRGACTGDGATGKASPRLNRTTCSHRLLPSMASPDLNGTRSGSLDSERKLIKPSPRSASPRIRSRDSVSHRKDRSWRSLSFALTPWSQLESSGLINHLVSDKELCLSGYEEAQKLNLQSPSPTATVSPVPPPQFAVNIKLHLPHDRWAWA